MYGTQIVPFMLMREKHKDIYFNKALSTNENDPKILFTMHLPVYLFSQVKAKFTVDDHSHYLFTPCVLTEWVLSLMRYDLTAGNQAHMHTY